MTNRSPSVSSMLHELSRQHACDGRIDIALAEQLTATILQSDDDEVDLNLLRHVIGLQSHVLSDMGSDSSLPRLREVSALQAVTRALVGK